MVPSSIPRRVVHAMFSTLAFSPWVLLRICYSIRGALSSPLSFSSWSSWDFPSVFLPRIRIMGALYFTISRLLVSSSFTLYHPTPHLSLSFATSLVFPVPGTTMGECSLEMLEFFLLMILVPGWPGASHADPPLFVHDDSHSGSGPRTGRPLFNPDSKNAQFHDRQNRLIQQPSHRRPCNPSHQTDLYCNRFSVTRRFSCCRFPSSLLCLSHRAGV